MNKKESLTPIEIRIPAKKIIPFFKNFNDRVFSVKSTRTLRNNKTNNTDLMILYTYLS